MATHITMSLSHFYVVMNTLTKDGIFVRYFKLIVHGSRDVEVVVT